MKPITHHTNASPSRAALFLLAALAAGCSGDMLVVPGAMGPAQDAPADHASTPFEQLPLDPVGEGAPGLEEISDEDWRSALGADEARAYLRVVAPMVASRALRAEELSRIDAEGGAAIAPIIEGWTAEEGFVISARNFIHGKLNASGARDGIDFELPANLMAQLVRQQRPYSEILTADSCYDRDGQPIACDTGAPYTAGVLTTRAYLINNASRFNLRRATTMMGVFACRGYPMEQDLQPPLPKEQLIPMFQANSAEEQTVEEARSGFGNGAGCYSCHSQFSAHAQLYVKFGEDGLYYQDADGAQDPTGELGRSQGPLFTSHMIDAEEAASEQSQMFGAIVSDLSQATIELGQGEVFLTCAARQAIAHTFGLSSSQAAQIDRHTVEELAQRLRALHGDPSWAQIVTAALIHPRVIQAALAGVGPEEGKPVLGDGG